MSNLLRQHRKGVILAAIATLLAGCGASSPGPENTATPTETRPKVVTTHSVLCDLTQQIALETIDLTCLLKGGTNAHAYEPTPSDRQAIENAQLVLYNGYALETNLVKIVESTSTPSPKIAVGEVAVPTPLIGEEHHHHEGEEHGHEEEKSQEGEEHLTPDPHVWHDAQNGIQMVEVIENNLAKIAPERAEEYQKNAEAIKNELTQIDNWIQSQIATIPPDSRQLITTHDAFRYYAQAYNIPIEGALKGLSTEQKPAASRVKELIDLVKTSKVPTIFVESTASPKLMETIAKEANVKLSERELLADGLGDAGSEGETYQKMLLANTQTIVEGLGGQFVPFQ
jgi:manganese/iron transport system substrate-binding protein